MTRFVTLTLMCCLILSANGYSQDTYEIPRVDPIPLAPVAKGLQPVQKPQAAQAQKSPVQALQKPQQAATQKSAAQKGSSRSFSVRGTGRGGRITFRDRLRLLKMIRNAQRDERRLARSNSSPQLLEASIR